MKPKVKLYKLNMILYLYLGKKLNFKIIFHFLIRNILEINEKDLKFDIFSQIDIKVLKITYLIYIYLFLFI